MSGSEPSPVDSSEHNPVDDMRRMPSYPLEDEDELLVHTAAPDLATDPLPQAPPQQPEQAVQVVEDMVDPMGGPAYHFDPLAEPPTPPDEAVPEEDMAQINLGALDSAAPAVEANAVVQEDEFSIDADPELSRPGGEISHATPEAVMLAYEPDSGPVKLYVKDPEKAEETKLGLKSTYYNFVIRTDSSLEGMIADGMEVKRRYSEFETLHKLLHSQYRGCFIPPLPEKSRRTESRLGAGSSLEDFLRLRRADLQAFLRSVVAHPFLVQSEALKLFLLQMGELGRNPAWLNMVEPPPASKVPAATSVERAGGSGGGAAPAPSGGVSNFMLWMKTSLASVGSTPPKKEPPADEETLAKSKEMLKDLEKLLRISCDTATVLCQDMDKLCEDFREFGRSMGMLARYEETMQGQAAAETEESQAAGRRCADLQKSAICSSKQHGLWRSNCVKTAAILVGLRDFHLLVPEAIRALEQRESALHKWEKLETDVWTASHQLENSKAQAGVEDKRTKSLAQTVANMEEQIKEAKATYELIKGRNYSELKRFGMDREASFRHMLSQFAATQASMVQASADAWSNLSNQYAAPPASGIYE